MYRVLTLGVQVLRKLDDQVRAAGEVCITLVCGRLTSVYISMQCQA